MFKKTWFLATLAIAFVALAIGAVVYTGSVLQPQWEKERIAKVDKEACVTFTNYVIEADKQDTIEKAYDKIFRGANAALALYDPTGTSKKETWGPEYDEFMRLGQMEYSISALGDAAFETVGSQITVIAEGCNALTATPTPTPSK
ncbi:MAG: hypothetical protein RL488_95 [Actinomycetota bacterium]